MRKNIVLFPWLLLLTICPLIVAGGEEAPKTTIELFAGQQSATAQASWKAYCEDALADPDSIWELRDGVLVLKAGPRGYVRTKDNFQDFRLTLQWRRPAEKKPGRGGVLIRMTGDDKIWPRSLEAQLNAGSPGDFWGLVGFPLSGPTERLKQVEHDQLGKLTNLTKTLDAEKPAGQWNQYEIIADGDLVTLKINGREVNRATQCDRSSGKICLTAEGDEIHFRNVRLTPVR